MWTWAKVQMPSGSCKTLASSIGPTSIQVPWCPLRLEGPQSEISPERATENPRIISISQRKSEKVTGLPRFAKHHLHQAQKHSQSLRGRQNTWEVIVSCKPLYMQTCCKHAHMSTQSNLMWLRTATTGNCFDFHQFICSIRPVTLVETGHQRIVLKDAPRDLRTKTCGWSFTSFKSFSSFISW